MSGSSQQRVAIVTGTNRGIGRGIAEGLAAQGIVVAATARSQQAADQVAAAIGNGAFGVALEVTSQSSVDAAVEAVVARSGRIDILVNNAGGHYDDGAVPSTLSDTEMLDALDLNLLGPLRLCRAVIPHMRATGWGRIVNVSSSSGTFASTWANAPAYGVSKAALNMFTFQLAKEVEGSGVLVNACCPGWVRTDMGGPNADKSIEEGADTPIWLAMLPDDGPSGGFFSDRHPAGW